MSPLLSVGLFLLVFPSLGFLRFKIDANLNIDIFKIRTLDGDYLSTFLVISEW